MSGPFSRFGRTLKPALKISGENRRRFLSCSASRSPDYPVFRVSAPDPIGAGDSLHNRNVASIALNVRHYRLALFRRGNGTFVPRIEGAQVREWLKKPTSALMKTR